MRKKTLVFLLSLAMVCYLTACGNKEQQAEKTEEKEVVVETQEETPTDDDAPVHPASRTQYRSFDGDTPVEIPETITYNADGGYTVKSTFVNKDSDSSFDIVTTYDSKGLITEYQVTEYSAAMQGGMNQTVKAAYGYPLSNVYNGVDPDGNAADRADDFVADGKISVDGSGNITFNTLDNIALTDLGNYMPTYFDERNRVLGNTITPSMANAFGLSEDTTLSTKVETDGQKMYVSYLYAGEGYNLETRKSEEVAVYAALDVFTFNAANYVESIEGYSFNEKNAGDVDIHDLSSFEADRYVYYTYDSENNVTEVRGKASGGFNMQITYEYGTGSSESETSAPTASNDVTGNWKCTSDGYTYDAIYFDADGTGNLYHGIDAYPLTYTFDGKKITMHADCPGTGDFVLYVYLDENKIVEGESDAVYIRQ